MICKHCGIEFTGRKRKYCSAECCKLAHGQNPNYKPETHCLVCGKPLLPGQKKYCSNNCCAVACSRRKGVKPYDEYRQARREESIEKNKRICQQCGEVFILRLGGRKSEGSGSYCSRQCYADARKQGPHKEKPVKQKVLYTTVCGICGKEFTSKYKRARCGRDCDLEYGRREFFKSNSAKKILRPRQCKECGKMFIPEYGNKKRVFCSDTCLNRYSHKIDVGDARKKARANGVYYEWVNPFKVFERDGWRCQLCGKKLKPKHRGTYRDDAPELDHIIPWAQGGEHSYRNTQCACRKCNQEKGARKPGQLRLFG